MYQDKGLLETFTLGMLPHTVVVQFHSLEWALLTVQVSNGTTRKTLVLLPKGAYLGTAKHYSFRERADELQEVYHR